MSGGGARRRVAFNMSLAGEGALTGPAHYALHTFEAMLELVRERGEIELIGLVPRGGEHHFSPAARAHLAVLPRFRGRIARVLFEQLVLPFRLRRQSIDLLFNPAFTGPVWGAARIVTAVPDVYFRVIPEMLGRGQRLFLSLMTPFCCARSWKVLTISHRTAADLVAYYPALAPKVFVTQLGSKFAAAAPPPRRARADGTPYVLIVASLTPNKNPGVVIEAVARHRRAGGALELLHVGRDPYGLLADAIRAEGAEAWVRTERGISDERLAELYRDALALVIPSHYEGFGMPALEAQSLGTPLICSTGGALPEVAGDGALYFDPDDAASLAAHIAALAARPELRDELIERGRANAARFSWARTARETLAQFEGGATDAGAAP